MERQKGSENLLTDVRIIRVGQDYWNLRAQLIEHYYKSWTKVGLPETPKGAQRKLDSYDVNSIYIATDATKEKVYGMLLTASSVKSSPLSLLRQFPSYSSFEGYKMPDKIGRPKASICFSVTADSSFRVKLPLLPVDISISEYLLFNYPFEPTMRKFAYSRIPGVWNSKIHDYYAANAGEPLKLGPTGMHESKYKAIVVATISGSRPEDLSAGGGNVFVAFPRSIEETKMFDEIKKERQRAGKIPFRKYKNFVLFTDISLT